MNIDVTYEHPDGTLQPLSIRNATPAKVEQVLEQLWAGDPPLPPSSPNTQAIAFYQDDPEELWQSTFGVEQRGIADCEDACRRERARLLGRPRPIATRASVIQTGPKLLHVRLRLPDGKIYDPTKTMLRASRVTPQQALVPFARGMHAEMARDAALGWIPKRLKRLRKRLQARMTRYIAKKVAQLLRSSAGDAWLTTQFGPLSPVIKRLALQAIKK